ncbi:MAG: response regulator [Lachnospiraceae bacterium]|nr:response regulator [Lachnospiraceae bacterium]
MNTKGACILIVDDDMAIGNMLEEALQGEGYAVVRAYSGTEALMVLEKERPDLILLDLMLPGLSGEEILPKIDGIPTIIMSAKSDTDHKVKLLYEGACDYENLARKPLPTGRLGMNRRSGFLFAM